jgi:hypothetical protein
MSDELVGEKIPEVVAALFRTAANRDLEDMDSENSEWMTCKYFFHVYRLSAPHGRSLYVNISAAPTRPEHFDLVLFDPSNEKVSPQLLRLTARWSLGREGPVSLSDQPVTWLDLYDNDNPVLVFETIGHNGTTYNAAIFHYLYVGSRLELRPVLARETALMGEKGDRYMRKLSPVGNGVWKLTTTHELPGKPETDLGYALIESPRPGTPFRILELHPRDQENRDRLISAWGSTNELLIHGYTFEY